MEDQAYLEPGFDPSTLTVPRLRSILVAHGVNYPASAKKPQLIEIFNKNIAPQAKKIRDASLRVKRTSRGIVNVPASGASTLDTEEDEDEELVPPPSTARRSGRRSTRAKTEEAQEVETTPRRSRHSTAPPESMPRQLSSKHVRQVESVVETEPEPKRPASRRSRQSVVTPHAVKTEEDDTPFSNDNVFQSGGSPPASKDRRRTTMGHVRDRDDERRKSREVRRRTEEYRTSRPAREQTDGAIVPSRKTFDMPLTRQSVDEELYQPDGEFTPDEQQELIKLEHAGEVVPTRRSRQRSRAGPAKIAPWAVTIAMLCGLATVWRQEKLEVGYCGVGRPTTELAGVEIPDWADFIRPQCEPCPSHAYCYDSLRTECESDFVVTQHPLSLGGLVPLPPTCEADSAKARKVQAVKARAFEELREHNAKYECGDAAKPEVKEAVLKQAISTKRRKGMSNQEFEDLWASALGEIQNADEVVSGSDGSGFTFRSTSLARIPLTCSIRRSVRQTLRQYLWQLIVVLMIASGGSYTKYSVTSNRNTEERAKQLASSTLRMLNQQASLHAQSPGSYGEGFISVAQLRDDVLRDEWSGTRRKKLWEKVQKKVENNTNVRAMMRTGRSGDVGRVWEWIGATGMIEDAGDRRRSMGFKDNSLAGERLIEAKDDSVDTSQMTRWEERPKQYF
ncbi:sister chromatid separation protein-like protein [Polychaeton citri CBS 116435]|uniref:Sister chromatid separation protein-like protein n=1 Tax=Polychaeton citri CBS 116435 TaxID=1314669 RepID=A0A9P4UNI1_9PEZI|nr:sister chromatid separation protein-like protein [Polychaeton citri CBS 116435]